MGYLLNNCRFLRLTSDIVCQCSSFSCKNDADIDSFFHSGNPDNYTDYEQERMAISHCFITKEEKCRMVCAFSLSATALRVDHISNRERRKVNKHIPYSKQRTQYPAILIGKLCVFDGFGRKAFPEGNVGIELMNLIKTMAINPDNAVAYRYLVVDALNKPKVLNYYTENQFSFLFSSEEEEYECLHARKRGILNKLWCKLLSFLGKSSDSSCPHLKTRLMVFDLILLRQ